MPIIAAQCLTSLSTNPLHTSESEESALDILCTLYDLYDAKRWVVRFISKHKDSDFHEIVLHFGEISEKLTDLIKHYSFLMNETMKEKALEDYYSLEREIEDWP